MSKFYAVARGRVPGVYTDWLACKLQVDKVTNALFKKFSTAEEAREFVASYRDPQSHTLNTKTVSPVKTLPLPLSPTKNNSERKEQIVRTSVARNLPLSLTPKGGSSNKTLNSDLPQKNRSTQKVACMPAPDRLTKTDMNATFDISNISVSNGSGPVRENGTSGLETTARAQSPSLGAPPAHSTCESDDLEERFEAFERMYLEFHKQMICEIRSTKKRLKSFKKLAEKSVSLQTQLQAFITGGMSSLENRFKTVMTEFSSELSCLQRQMTENNITVAAPVMGVKGRTLTAKRNTVRATRGRASSSRKTSRSKLSAMLLPMTPAQVLLANKRSYSMDGKTAVEPPVKVAKTEACDDSAVIVVKDEPTDETDNGGSHTFHVDAQGYVQVYTDGACERNGRFGAKAGIGVWFGQGHPLNFSEPVKGRPTNNTAEIQAAEWAVCLARQAGVRKLCINTDSEFLINSMTKWIHKWKRCNWQLATGGPVKNKENFQALERALQGFDVKWNHVRGHVGIHGNEMADSLARAGAAHYKNS